MVGAQTRAGRGNDDVGIGRPGLVVDPQKRPQSGRSAVAVAVAVSVVLVIEGMASRRRRWRLRWRDRRWCVRRQQLLRAAVVALLGQLAVHGKLAIQLGECMHDCRRQRHQPDEGAVRIVRHEPDEQGRRGGGVAVAVGAVRRLGVLGATARPCAARRVAGRRRR